MAEITPTTPKPPPLHDRADVFEDIANSYNGGNNLHLVQAEYRGALKLLRGTAIPKNHDVLAKAITAGAELIAMADDSEVPLTVQWVESERQRHRPTIETVWPWTQGNAVESAGCAPPIVTGGKGGGIVTDSFRNENDAR